MKLPLSPLHIVSLVCLFLSGAAGLVCQVAWNRYLALFLGHSSYATVLVLCAFMGGLALGNLVIGKLADSAKRPLLLYAGLELGIALYAFAFGEYYSLSEAVHSRIQLWLGSGHGALPVSKLFFAVGLVLPPATLMGGTLPPLVRVITRSSGETHQRVSSLYAFNSFGAVAGCLIGDFWWIPAVGLPITVAAAGALNLAAALIAGYAARFDRLTQSHPGPHLPSTPPLPSNASATTRQHLALAGVAVSGFAALLYEVAWNRILALSLGSSTNAFSIMLATFILGIAMGSWMLSQRRIKGDVLRLFAWCEAVLAGVLFLSLFQYDSLPYWFSRASGLLNRTPESASYFLWLQTLICIVVMIIPTCCLGMTLPLATQAAMQEFNRAGSVVGRVFAFNTLGTVLGAALTGLWLLPALGLPRLLGLGIGLNAAVAIGILHQDWLQQNRQRWLSLPAGVLGITIFTGALFDYSWQHGFTLGLFREAAPASFREFQRTANAFEMRYYKDGAPATVSLQSQTINGAERWSLRVNGKVDASNATDVPTQLLLAHIPLLLKPESSDVLVIGLGSGMTCGAALQHPSVKHLDVVEISPEVAEVAQILGPHNNHALKDPRTRLHIDDAKSFLRFARGAHDVIISEPSNPWMAGVAGVFSREHFENCRRALKPGGLMVQWVQTYETSDEALKTVLATFFSVFSQGSVWQTGGGDIILTGASAPLALNFDAMSARFQEPAVRKDLERIDIYRLPVLLAREIVSGQNAPFLVEEGVPLESDLYPTLEYLAQKGFFLRQRSTLLTSLDESLSPRANTILASYIKQRPLDALDLRGMMLFFNSFGLPDATLARSIIHQWRTLDPNARLPLEFLASTTHPNAREEQNAAALGSSTNLVFASNEKDPELLKWYGQALMQTYRGRKSSMHLPDSSELERVLARLVEIDPSNRRVHMLRLAELAWDRGQDERCLELGSAALTGDAARFGPMAFSADPAQPARVLHSMIEIRLRSGKLDEATELCREAFKRFYAGPQANPVHPPLELSCRKVLTRLAVGTRSGQTAP